MPRRFLHCLGIFIVLTAIGESARPANAADKSAAEILPPTTVGYLEITHPKDLIAFVFDSPLKQQIDKSEQYRKAIDDPKFKEFQGVLGLIEQRAGAKWREALETTTSGGIVMAFDGETQGVVLLAKSSDAKATDSIRDALFSLVRDDAKNKGNPDPIEQIDYRGKMAYKIGEAIVANVGPWLMISNKADLAKSVADRFTDGGASLAKDHGFAESHKAAALASTAWAFLHLEPLRAIADPAFLDAKYKSDNPGVEFLVGGLLPVLRKADYLSASLSVGGGDVKLSIAAPIDLAALTKEKKFFFAAAGDGAAKPLRPDGTIASISIYRDASAMWLAGPDLFTEAVATQMAHAESGLSTFFGGKQFGTDVLGAYKPQIQFVAAKQDYKVAGVTEPALRLPGFALIVRVKDDQYAALRKKMRTGFQTAIAFTNLDGGTKGRPALELQNEKRGTADIEYATYDMTDKATAKDDVYLNFSPAMVTSKNCVMLCSTKQIAEQLADLADKQGDTNPVIAENTLIDIDGAAVASLIKADREQLIAQNMLEKGHERAAAEQEINLLQTLVGYVQDAQIRLTPRAHDIQLDLEVKTPMVK